MSIRSIIDAPFRFARYINQPSLEMQRRYEALPEDEKAKRREWYDKLYWVYQAFPSPFPGKRAKRRL